MLDRLVLVRDGWTMDNGLLTPTMKIRRSVIEARYAGLIERAEHERAKVVVEVGREPLVQ